jgi:hypothetical protein
MGPVRPFRGRDRECSTCGTREVPERPDRLRRHQARLEQPRFQPVGPAPRLSARRLGFDEGHVLRPKVHDVTVRVFELGQSVVRQRGRPERVEGSLDRARRAHRVAGEKVQQGRVGHDDDPTPGGRSDALPGAGRATPRTAGRSAATCRCYLLSMPSITQAHKPHGRLPNVIRARARPLVNPRGQTLAGAVSPAGAQMPGARIYGRAPGRLRPAALRVGRHATSTFDPRESQ